MTTLLWWLVWEDISGCDPETITLLMPLYLIKTKKQLDLVYRLSEE